MTPAGNSLRLPGSRLRRFAEKHLDNSAVEKIVLPIIADLQHEYLSLPRSGMMGLQVLLRGYWSFWKAIGLQMVFTPYNIGELMSLSPKKKWASLAFTLIILGAAASYMILRPQVYRSESRIMIESEIGFGMTVSAEQARQGIEDRFLNMRLLLESKSFAQGIIERSGLLGFGKTGFEMEDAVNSYQRNLEFSRSDNVLTVTFHSATPDSAQRVAKFTTEQLVQHCIGMMRNRAEVRAEFLTDALNGALADLKAVDKRVTKRIPEEMQALTREQARLQRRVDEIDRLVFDAQLAASALRRGYSGIRIIDLANLPERARWAQAWW